MPRNFSRLVMVLGAAFLACAPSLHAQSGQPVRGDVDGDGRVTAADARIVSDFLVGKPVPAGVNVRVRGDVNGDGRITSLDAAIIARSAAGRDMSRFPVGQALPEGSMTLVECAADVRARSISCGEPGSLGGARAYTLVGGQDQNVKLVSSNLVINPVDSTFAFNVTVQNLLKQAMAADSTAGGPLTPNANGVRVFFFAGPTETEAAPSGSGHTVRVANSDGKQAYMGTGPQGDGQFYFQYAGADLGPDGILAPGETSSPHNWVLKYDPGVNKFNFVLFLATQLPYPKGWVDVYPPNNHASSPTLIFSQTVVAGRTLQLTDSVRNPFGGYIPGAPVSWSNTTHGFASVNMSSGLVTTTVGASGVDSVTATSGPRTGTVEIVVTPPTGANSVITASPLSVTAGDTSLVTVQVKDGFGNNVTTGGDAVSLTTSLGTLVGATTGATATPVDQGNGTYTAKLTSPTVGTANLTGTVLGNAIGTTASVTFTPGVPASIEKIEPLVRDTVNPVVAITPAPKVRVKDALGNVVPGASVTFAPSAGSSVTGSPVVTNASGEATVGSWTINTGGLKTLTVTATPGSAPAAIFEAYGNLPPLAVRDSMVGIGNVQITAAGLLGNDSDPESEAITVVPGTFQTAGLGSVTLTAAGGVTYNSAVGYTGVDSVAFTVTDPRGLTAPGKLVIRVPDRFWFVQGGGSGNGTKGSPSGNFTFGAALAAKDSIFLLSTATVASGVTLPNGGALIGAGSTTISRALGGSPNMTVDPVTLLTNGSTPTLTVTTGTGVTLAAGGTGYIVKGLALSTGAGAGISGTTFGSLDLASNELSINATGGAALNLTTGTLSGSLSGLTASGGTNNVLLSGVTFSGAVSLGGGTLSGASASALSVTNSISPGASDVLSYTGSITNATAGAANATVAVSGGNARLALTGNVTQTGSGAAVSVAGGHVGTLTFNTGTVSATAGTGLQFDNADGNYDFGSSPNLSLNGGDAGIDVLNNSGGTFTFASTASITNPTAEAVRLNASSPTFTFPGRITKTNGSTGITVTSNTGGTISFGSRLKTITATGGNVAVNLATNGTATITSVDSLVITSASGAGYNATGGGTVSVQGANNSVNSTGGGTAVNVSSTTIAGTGLTFKSVNATGAGANGIVLSSTGSGPFTVTGDGNSDPNNTTRGRTTAKEGGGTVALGSGGTISGRSGHGVSLATTGAVTLRNMVITGSASSGDGINAASTGRLTVDNTRITGHASDHGILGSTVAGLALHHSEVDNNGTTVGVVEGPDIWNIRLLELTGTDSIRNSNIHHSQEDVLGILNTSGTLNLTVLNTNITDTGTGAGGTTAFAVSASGTANVTLNLQNDSINRGRSRGVDFGTGTGSSAVLNTTINNSQFHQNGAAMSIVQGSGGTNTFNITNNNLQSNDANSLQAMIINRAGSPTFNSFGVFTGTISGNIIGTTGVAHSGSGTSSGIEVESNGSGGFTRVAVVNNTIRQVATHGIQIAAVDGNIGGTAAPTVEARVQGNNISVLNPIGLDGINILSGALNTDDVTMCVDIVSNTSVGIRNGLRVRGSGAPTAPATVQLEGWDGSTARSTYFVNRPNTLTGGIAQYNDNTPSAPGGYVAVANCNTP